MNQARSLPAQSLALPNVPRGERPYSPAETLYYYDGPLLFWLPVAGRHVLAMAVLEEPEAGRPWPFILGELTAEAAEALLANKLTLLKAYLGASALHLIPDFGAEVLSYQPLVDLPEQWQPGDVMLTLE